jgi:hypothetical protein
MHLTAWTSQSQSITSLHITQLGPLAHFSGRMAMDYEPLLLETYYLKATSI